MGHLLAAKQQLTDPGDWEMSPEWCGLQIQAHCYRQVLEPLQSNDKAIACMQVWHTRRRLGQGCRHCGLPQAVRARQRPGLLYTADF